MITTSTDPAGFSVRCGRGAFAEEIIQFLYKLISNTPPIWIAGAASAAYQYCY